MSQNLSSAAVVIGAFRVNFCHHQVKLFSGGILVRYNTVNCHLLCGKQEQISPTS